MAPNVNSNSGNATKRLTFQVTYIHTHALFVFLILDKKVIAPTPLVQRYRAPMFPPKTKGSFSSHQILRNSLTNTATILICFMFPDTIKGKIGVLNQIYILFNKLLAIYHYKNKVYLAVFNTCNNTIYILLVSIFNKTYLPLGKYSQYTKFILAHGLIHF